MASNRPKLFLHLGTHKTGTTALQAFSVSNRDVLRRHGLLYPDFSPFLSGPKDGHHPWAHAFSSKPTKLSKIQAQALVGYWQTEAVEHNLSVMVSAEAMYRHVIGEGSYRVRRQRYLTVLKKVLSCFDVVPVVVFRRPDDYVRSLYQESVANASKPRQLPTFADYVANPPPGVNYTANANVIHQVFGTIRVLLYEELTADEGSLGESLYRALGYHLEGHTPTERVRTSLTPVETVIKNAVNQHFSSRKQSHAFIEALREPEMQALIHQAYPESRYDLWPDQVSRGAFLKSREGDLAKLRKRYLPEHKVLFPPLKTAEDETVTAVPPPPEFLMQHVMSCLPINSLATDDSLATDPHRQHGRKP
ncbi:hypothetical protein ACLUEY_06850 [Vreelandella aquamarina]